MPYTMTHLLIAEKFAGSCAESGAAEIADRGLFLLGSIAPDAVHSRADFTKRIKARSHVMQEDAVWGEIYEEAPLVKWYGRLRDFYARESRLADGDAAAMSFLMGYVTHILPDISGCSLFYVPNWIRFGLDDVEGYRAQYRTECILQDNWLYRESGRGEELMRAVARAAEHPRLGEILERLELDRHITAENIRGSVRYTLDGYAVLGGDAEVTAAPAALEGLRFVTEENTLGFIDTVAEQCVRMLYAFPDAGRTFRIAEL